MVKNMYQTFYLAYLFKGLSYIMASIEQKPMYGHTVPHAQNRCEYTEPYDQYRCEDSHSILR